MDINDYLIRLANGILSNLSISEEGTISDTATRRVVNIIEEGLLDLYSRFILKEDVLLLSVTDDRTIYRIHPDHTVSQLGFECDFRLPVPTDLKIQYGSLEDFEEENIGYLDSLVEENWDPVDKIEKYISDLVPSHINMAVEGRYILDNKTNPYRGNFIKPLSIFDINGCEVPIDDLGNCYSVFMVDPETLQVPHPELHGILSIEYQARHPAICLKDMGEGRTKAMGRLELPRVLLQHLNLYVGSKVHGYMNSSENTAKSLEYMREYERLCQITLEIDHVNSSKSYSNTAFENRGWV